MSFITTSPDGTSHLFVDFPGDPWGKPFASGEDIWAQQSPEGAQIAYTAPTSDGAYELRIVNADRSNIRRIISGSQITARWSPDSSKIWYSNVPDERRVEVGIALVDGSSTVPLQLSDNPDTTWSARWSPDGSRISYAADANGDSFPEQIWIAEADGSRSRLIADISSRQNAPSERIQGISTRWSEDSTHLWFLLHGREPYERDGVYTILLASSCGQRRSPAGSRNWLPTASTSRGTGPQMRDSSRMNSSSKKFRSVGVSGSQHQTVRHSRWLV